MDENANQSRIFASYAAVGLVSGPTPALLQSARNGKWVKLMTAVGNTIHTFDALALRLEYVSELLPSDVRCMTLDEDFVYAGCDGKIVAVRAAKRIEYIIMGGHEGRVQFLLSFGDHLISVDDCSQLVVWDKHSREIYTEFKFDVNTFRISAICHPATYLNKLLLGSENGPLRLLNLKTGNLVYDFTGWSSGVTAIEQSPVIDVVAIGLLDGRIQVHNLRYDETIMTFKHGETPVRAVAFRSDAVPMMVSANDVGQLAVWDLEKKELAVLKDEAHQGRIVTLTAINNEPCLLTTGEDNSIKCWIFDANLGTIRLYRLVEGHSKPPLFIRFHGQESEGILSAGGDGKLKIFSTYHKFKSINLGTAGLVQRCLAKKRRKNFEDVRLPPVVFFHSSTARENAWENIVCIHRDNPLATTWTNKRRKIGKNRFLHKRFTTDPRLLNAKATCCAASSCGNFALIAYSTGHVDIYNTQSGLYRGSLRDANLSTAHTASVQGVCIDALSQLLATGCTQGHLKIWNFSSKTLIHKQSFGVGFKRMHIHEDNNLLAMAMDNLSIIVYDILCRRVARRFENCHRAAITDLAFSPGGHWLMSSSQDCTVKVWDLPSAALVDVLAFSHACKSLTISPSGEYLATCHIERPGIYLWVNKALYRPYLTLRPLPPDYQPTGYMDLPVSHADEQEQQDDDDDQKTSSDMEDETDDQNETYKSPEQIGQFCSTSQLPSSRWANLLDLDLIRQRNKPKEPPKRHHTAPFLLSSIHQQEQQPGDGEDVGAIRSRVMISAAGHLDRSSTFRTVLDKCQTDRQFWSAFDGLKSLGLAAVHQEIRSLTLDSDSEQAVAKFLQMLCIVLSSGRYFELANAYMGVLLQVGRHVFLESTNDRLQHWLKEIDKIHDERWRRLDQLFIDATAMVAFISSSSVV